MHRLLLTSAVLASCVFAAPTAAETGVAVDAELVLAVDVSRSMTREGMGSQWHLDDLDVYYEHCVIGGAGAFVLPVLRWEDFPDAVRRKLVLELSHRLPAAAPAATFQTAAADGYDCLIGERIWDSMFGEMQ